VPGYELAYIRISRLRGFKDTVLRVPDRIAFVIGPNNAGKTSALRLLDWALNEVGYATLMGDLDLSAQELALMIPASKSGGRGRRLTLGVRVAHRGSQRRYGCDNEGIAALRIGVTAAGRCRINLGHPHHGEAEPDQLAWELLERLRSATVFTLIPSSRDAQSQSFVAALRAAALARIAERALHTRQAGSYAEYRNTKKALGAIDGIASDLLAPLWDDIQQTLPAGMAKSAKVKPDVTPSTLVEWLAYRTAMSLVTGDHDTDGVAPEQVGAGLQSLLELAINRAGGAGQDVDWIVGLEEPEAFLHPSAQRAFARSLATDEARLIVSTHSPIVVDEANYTDVVLVRDHKFYYPRRRSEPARETINSARTTGGGAEMLFAQSVLLVEGPGDRMFFEGLRRRLAADTDLPEADSLWVVSVGGHDFSAWLKLLRGFGDATDRPIRWRVVADDDAASSVLNSYRSAGHPLGRPLTTALESLADEYAQNGRSATTDTLVARVNVQSARRAGGPFLLPGALEDGMLSDASTQTVDKIAAIFGADCPEDRAGLITYLTGDKAKWKRTIVADNLPWDELSPSVRTALERWVGAVVGIRTARSTLNGLAS